VAQMNWLEWLKAEGYTQTMMPQVLEANQNLLKAQQEFDLIQPYIAGKGYQKTDACPVELAVTLTTLPGLVHTREGELIAQLLLDVIKTMAARIERLERRIEQGS